MIIRHAKLGRPIFENALRPTHTVRNDPRTILSSLQSCGFHASRPNLVINEALQLSASTFHVVHETTGLTWAASIPLTAALIQLAFSPLHYFIEKNTKKRSQSTNVLFAWRNIYQAQVMQAADKEERDAGNSTESNARRAEYEVAQKLKTKQKQLQQESGYWGPWVSWTSLSYIPVWLSNLGALRRMCGTTEMTAGDTITPDASEIVLEPSFLTDGSLWFHDLTVADPTFLLPLTAWALMGISLAQIRRGRAAPPQNVVGKTLQKLITLLVASAGPLFIAWGVPSAIMLAIIGSTSMALMRRAALDKIVGKATGVLPAKPRKAVLKKQYSVKYADQW